MWNSGNVVTKASQLFNAAGFPLSVDNKKKLYKTDDPVICSICRQREPEAYKITDIFGDGFTSFNLFSHSKFICKDCAGLVNDFYRKKLGKVIIYFNPETSEVHSFRSKVESEQGERIQLTLSDEEKEFWKNFLLNPPKGYFLISVPSKQNAHYVIFTPLCYSDGSIKNYQFSYGESIMNVDVEELNQIVNLNITIEQLKKLKTTIKKDKEKKIALEKELIELYQQANILRTKDTYLLYLNFRLFFD